MPKDLKRHIADHYDDPDVAAWVHDRVVEAGTADAILSGQSTLPSQTDARRLYHAEKGIKMTPQAPDEQRALLGQVTQRIGALESTLNDKVGPALSDLGKRLAALEAHVTAPQGH